MDDKVTALINELVAELQRLGYPVKLSPMHIPGEEPCAAIFLLEHWLVNRKLVRKETR